MVILAFPRFLSTSFSPIHSLSPPSSTQLFGSKPVPKMSTLSEVRSRAAEHSNSGGAAVIWFKQDLRIDDHLGLKAASRFRTIIPLYVFDHRILSRYSDEMLESVRFAVEDLKRSLKNQNSDLIIRFGNSEMVIQDLVKEVKATTVFAEEEVEYNLKILLDRVQEALAFDEHSPRIVLWNTPFFDTKSLKDLPESYNEFKRLKLSVFPPILQPELPNQEMVYAWGSVPTVDDLKKFMNVDVGDSSRWTSMKNNSARDILYKDQIKNIKNSDDNFGQSTISDALAAYLRSDRVKEGDSFGTIFGSALQLGIISRRKAYHDVMMYGKEQNNGLLVLPFGDSTTTITETICSREWYWLLASRSQTDDDAKFRIRIWRWKGYLIQYTVNGEKGPAILLVHGFGVFLEHYRDNIYEISEKGNRVYAVTLFGFGRSEKPNVLYTELIWADFLRDFIIQVVGEKVHIVGNSIGGYFVAIVGGVWPGLVKSVVLINSAGNVVPEYSHTPLPRERRSSGVARFGAKVLVKYLRFGIKDILKSYYPTKENRADDYLIAEMLRASYDPGVAIVLASIFGLNLSIPLNYLLKEFEEKVLVVQGMKDPLSDSVAKLAMLRENCKGIKIKELEAGHCPHDEVPEEVNTIITDWVVSVESAW